MPQSFEGGRGVGGSAPLTPPSEVDARVYGWAAGRPRFVVRVAAVELGLSEEVVRRSVGALCRMHLLRPVPAGPEAGGEGDGEEPDLVAVPPDLASASLLAGAEADLRTRLAEIERVRAEISGLTPLYERGRSRRPAESVQEVLDLSAMVELIDVLTLRCRSEVLTCQPGGPRAPHLLEQAFARDLAMIRRGVVMRTLYQHTARRHPPTREYVRRVTAAGGEVRTLTALFGQLLAFDRETVVIPHHAAYDGAVVIRDPSTVAYLCGVFDHSWTLAAPYEVTVGGAPLDEIKEAIIRLLSEGMKDEMIARRLGMSLRTCRKHIAEVMEVLGANSRFQAGYLARARVARAD
ncbi:LuxR C-terminal-related transcriptional regulator (plasmid) [Streptomyces sp. BI20]|uniref:helix-turn-helix transcriptional regulator n=1 Tax=Streptomyces sp. BI20 TaxID=3403460 RepID=UPI003C73AAE6